MKHILKNTEPQDFINWKNANTVEIERQYNAGASGQILFDLLPTKRSSQNLSNEYSKEELRDVLAQEQFYTCCYCMAAIKAQPLDTKVEHYLPKETYKPKEVFEYYNLLVACNGGERTRPIELSCDSKKGSKDPSQFDIVSPLSKDCETHFDYEENGNIKGKTPQGQKTIDFLNLNCKRLNIQRKEVINTYIFDILQENLDTESEISYVKTPYWEGNKLILQPFCMAIATLLKNYP